MKHTVLTLLLVIFTVAANAQDSGLLTLRLETRVDYLQEYIQDTKINTNSGFKGKYLNIRMDGTITDGLTYSYRQRLNKPNKDASFFDATDWMTVTYTKGNWSASTGKQVVGIGGFEYDGAPIDLYFCSEYWNNIPCYKIGISGAYTTDDMNDKFLLQVCESPFRNYAINPDYKEMFAYNAMWYGSHGLFSSIWSVNMIEYLPGRFINYIALGNKFTFNDFTLDLDIMNRAVSAREFLGRDMSVIGKLQWSPSPCINIFAKVTHDFNDSDEIGDWCVLPGTSITRVGGGIEYFPVKSSRNFRLHLNCCHTTGVHSSASGALQPHQTIVDAGVTWFMNLLNIKK